MTPNLHYTYYIGLIKPEFGFKVVRGTSWRGWTGMGRGTVVFGLGQERLKLVVFPLNALMLKDNLAQGDEASTAEKSGFKDIL